MTAFINRMVKALADGVPDSALSNQDKERLAALNNDVIIWAKEFPQDKDVPSYLFHAAWVVSKRSPERDDAAEIYNFLISNYPRSQYAAKAKVELKKLGY